MEYAGKARLSTGLEVKQCNTEFLQKMGSSTYCASILKIIHADDVDNVERIADSIKLDGQKNFVFRMLSNGEYKSFYAKMKRIAEGNEEYFDIEIFDIAELADKIEDYTDTISKYRIILASENTIYFEYDILKKRMKLFKIMDNRDTVKAETSFDQWAEEFIVNNIIADENINKFHKLCRDLESGKNVHCVIEVGEEQKEYLVVNGRGINRNYEKRYICGTMSYCERDGINQSEMENIDSSLDELTGLYRKNAIRKLAEEKLNSNSDEMASLVILDIDDFKHVNDTYGHMFGDTVIARVAEIIKEAVGERGVVGRFGGDEFYILVDRAKDKDELRCILRAIKTNVYAARWQEHPSASVTVSVGSATYPVNGKNYDIIFKKADRALYLAKEKGKNRYIIYEEAIHGEIKNIKTADKFGIISNLGTGNSQSAMFMNNITTELMSKGKAAIPAILEEIKKQYFLDRINVYYGDDFEKVFYLGSYKRSSVKEYVDKDYIDLFDDSNVLVMNFTYKLEATHSAAFKRLSNEEVYSAVQCIIGSKDDVKGICSFEHTGYKKMFAHDEIMLYSLFANLMTIVLANGK